MIRQSRGCKKLMKAYMSPLLTLPAWATKPKSQSSTLVLYFIDANHTVTMKVQMNMSLHAKTSIPVVFLRARSKLNQGVKRVC